MGNPHQGDQLRKAPTQALRAVFAGIGRIILAADKARGDTAGNSGGLERRPPGRHASTRLRSLDRTGNVRLLSAEELSDLRPATEPQVVSTPAAVAADDVDEDPPAAEFLTGNVPVGSSLVVHELPLAGYDRLSLPSIRARLRSLDVSQLQALMVYERKHAGRPEVLTMIERRIEKIESGQ